MEIVLCHADRTAAEPREKLATKADDEIKVQPWWSDGEFPIDSKIAEFYRLTYNFGYHLD
jgi:hypothetical protein